MLSKFRRMTTENSSEQEICQQQILSTGKQIPSRYSARLSPPMPRRPSIRDVLARKMRDKGGITTAELCRRARAKGYSVSTTAINEMLRGKTTNPGIVTLDAAAAGLDLSTVEFVAEILGDKTEDANFKMGRFGAAAELFKSLTPTQQLKAEPFIDGLLLQMQHIKNQK